MAPASSVEKAVLSSSDCVFQCKYELPWLLDPTDIEPSPGHTVPSSTPCIFVVWPFSPLIIILIHPFAFFFVSPTNSGSLAGRMGARCILDPLRVFFKPSSAHSGCSINVRQRDEQADDRLHLLQP